MRAMAEVGHVLHFSLNDLLEITCEELAEYHRQACRLSGAS